MSEKKMFYKGYKYKIYPTEEQAKQLDEFIHLFRYVYNWGIDQKEKYFEENGRGKKSITWKSMSYILSDERSNNPEMSFLKNIPLTTARHALINVDRAFENYFHKRSKYPKHKTKKEAETKASFNTRAERFSVKNDSIRIEGMKTRISLGFDCGLNINKAINPTVSRDNLGNYYISFSLLEEVQEIDIPKTEPIGIDLGIRQNYVLSTGEVFNYPNDKLERLKRIRTRRQRHVTRDQKRRIAESTHTISKCEDEEIPMSKRAKKRLDSLRRVEKKIANTIKTTQQTIAKRVVERNPEYVCMETFSVTEIGKKSKYMQKQLWENSFYQGTQIMKNACEQRDISFYQVPIDYPSTQICSNCGNRKNMHGLHTYKCPVCGMVEDRDVNAAINLRNYGLTFSIN